MKKNRFLTFFFSIIPGCGLMYLGYMKKGLQIMLTFAIACFISGFFMSYDIYLFAAFFFMLLPVIWFYQMFDAMHTMTRMKNQGLELPADDGFFMSDKLLRFSPMQNRKITKIAAGVLIFVGIFSLIMGILGNMWRYPIFNHEIFGYIISAVRHELIPAIISIVLIVVGFKLLKGSKSSQNKEKINDIFDEEDRG